MNAADEVQPDVVALHQADLVFQVSVQQLHQEFDLGMRAAQKIFRRESIERKRRQVDAGGRLHHVTDGLHALAVPGDARQMAALGPAAVAVHDDGYVFGELSRVQLAEDFSFFAVQPGRNYDAQTCLSIFIHASTATPAQQFGRKLKSPRETVGSSPDPSYLKSCWRRP